VFSIRKADAMKKRFFGDRIHVSITTADAARVAIAMQRDPDATAAMLMRRGNSTGSGSRCRRARDRPMSNVIGFPSRAEHQGEQAQALRLQLDALRHEAHALALEVQRVERAVIEQQRERAHG
jgi:hypothetical protein